MRISKTTITAAAVAIAGMTIAVIGAWRGDDALMTTGLVVLFGGTPATAAAGVVSRSRAAPSLVAVLMLPAWGVVAGGCQSQSLGQQYKAASSVYQSTAAAVETLARNDMLSEDQIETAAQVDRLLYAALDELRIELIEGDDLGAVTALGRVNRLLDRLIRMQLEAEDVDSEHPGGDAAGERTDRSGPYRGGGETRPDAGRTRGGGGWQLGGAQVVAGGA